MATELELTEVGILKFINTFSEKVKGKRTAKDLPEGFIDGELSNRGNKLKTGADKVHRDQIDGFNNDIDDIETIHYNRQQRAVVKRRRIDTYHDEENDSNQPGIQSEAEYDDDDDDPYLGIDIESILAPIQQTTDLVTRESISRTYSSEILRHLAQQTVETIEKEQDLVIQLTSLLDIFLGEDSNGFLEAKLALPEYDFNLSQEEREKKILAENLEDNDRRITRKQSTQEVDPFFALPTFKIDPDYGLSPQDAEDTRQLTQVAVQRTQEYLRSLQTLRNGIVRAQYVKEKLYNWAKEMNGDPDESDIYQKELASESTVKESEKVTTASSVTATSSATKEKDSSSSSNSTPVPEVATRRSNRRRRN